MNKVILTSLFYSFVSVYFGGLFITLDYAWLNSASEAARSFALLSIVGLTGIISLFNSEPPF